MSIFLTDTFNISLNVCYVVYYVKRLRTFTFQSPHDVFYIPPFGLKK